MDAPSEPLNLNYEILVNDLYLYWNHPQITNGKLKLFKISFKDNNNNTNALESKVEKHMREYNYTLFRNKKITFSTSYDVEIYACTIMNVCGYGYKYKIFTPPEILELNTTVENNEQFVNSITNTSITIQLPKLKKFPKNNNSSMYGYIILSSFEHHHANNNSDLIVTKNNQIKQLLLKEISTDNYWFADEFEFDKNENRIIEIGNRKVLISNRLDETLTNRPLNPDTKYNITILLLSMYGNQFAVNKYRIENVKTTETPHPVPSGFYAFILLLLLIPFFGYILYWFYLKNNGKPSLIIRQVVGSNIELLENHNEPNVAPLTNNISKPNLKHTVSGPKTVNETNNVPINNASRLSNSSYYSRLIPLSHFEEYLKKALETGELNQQHSLFPRGQTKSWDYGMLKPNKFKNRYNNLIAYDDDRVKLKKINNDQYSDYINASYINGYKQQKAYIATQGPKLATLNDFWRMIWQENIQYIIMLTNIIEAGKNKCEKYWPDIDSSQEYDDIDVYFEKSEIFADFEYRTFLITKENEKRQITQLHFTSWPDHGVPLYAQSLVPFLKKMLTIPQSIAPIVVHCSAGVGRTGTIILIDICLRMAAREGSVDVLKFLHQIREQRANLVDNIDQYKLVHMVLLECLLAPDTNLPCDINLSNTVQKLIDEDRLKIQLDYLKNSTWQDEVLNFTSIKIQSPENKLKNRFQDIIPVENQIYISRYPSDDPNSDYINAVPVDGFRFKEQFIVTQTPMQNTMKDFWRMVIEKSINIIVSLNNIPLDDETCYQYWPMDKNSNMYPLPTVTLKYLRKQNFDFYNIYYILLDNQKADENNPRSIQVIQYNEWSYENHLPNNLENLITFWEAVEHLSRGNHPIIVSCYNGATASGLFVAISFIIEKIKLEQQCDPCLAVRVIRRNRKQFIINTDQFECLYKSAVMYLKMFETYSNFQLTTGSK